ncbi:sigma-70 family RNA polymerase sigma factor [Aquihabitans sp. G128]|uniref:RNA polymerase sigma factor n=1 Tax=Aquihabitans sp. G128 TaxID=2849779 RepID=UPI001C230BB0|nr:sigma-70 family RNA polymerase sigma factor [Aquihabitans sp. G128]QXC62474.1 sigma-70 family RNA polymerase sigma factor [Aquihabitans sp. G128]
MPSGPVDSHGAPTADDAFRAHAPRVLAYLQGQRVAEPEDLLGDVFVQVARSIGSFQGDEHLLRRWIFTIARNCVVDDRRRRSRRPELADAPVPDRPVDEVGVTDPDLVRALAGLTPDQREVIGLRFVADLPLEDVAEITGRPVGAVKSMQHRALAALARTLEADDGAGER